MKTRSALKTRPTSATEKKGRISQSDVPAFGLTESLRIANAIAENYGYNSTKPLDVAQALSMSPSSSTFRMLCGASIAYGLTDGGYNASEIGITALGLKIVKPKAEQDELAGRREALLKPKAVREFLTKYQGAPLPREEIALNVLDDMGVPKARGSEILRLILTEAEAVGFLKEIKGKKYVDISTTSVVNRGSEEEREALRSPPLNGEKVTDSAPTANENGTVHAPSTLSPNDLVLRKKRVFITHGKNQTFIDPIKKLLSFGELEAVVSVDRQSVSQPVPEKVMNDMRSCGGAIIHVDAEHKMLDSEAKEHLVLNPNVLIEIGAAMALYGRRFILLVKDGIKLPSNLQGLFEVRYLDDSLDGQTTIKLLESINDLKRQLLPDEAK